MAQPVMAILFHDRWQFRKNITAIPVLDFSGSTDFGVPMQYKCNKCKKTCNGTDGNYFHQIPEDLRSAYPVDPRFAINNVQIHLTEASSRIVESLMITHGNGDQLSRMLLELRGKKHEDLEVQYYNQILRTIRSPSITESDCFPSFNEYFGKDSPSGVTLRSMYQNAKYSSLNRTGISDNMRGTREIQSVGCDLSVSTDYTFAMGKNYQSRKCVFTATVDTGERALFVATATQHASEFSHALEQFAKRPNVNPKMHVVDDYPKN